MPVLPLIDLSLLAGWTSLLAGFLLKTVAMMTSYRPTVFGLTSTDFFMIAMASLLFAIALAARTWVKAQDPAVTARRRRRETLDAWESLPRAEAVVEKMPDRGESAAAAKQATGTS